MSVGRKLINLGVVFAIFICVLVGVYGDGYCGNAESANYCDGSLIPEADCCPATSVNYGQPGLPSTE